MPMVKAEKICCQQQHLVWVNCEFPEIKEDIGKNWLKGFILYDEEKICNFHFQKKIKQPLILQIVSKTLESIDR